MITADELRNMDISSTENGYSKKEVNDILDKAAETIEAYILENESVYHKLEVLAAKIEEYRAEEDIIKTAIIKAEKTAEEIRVEAKDKATNLLEESEKKVNEIVASANEKAEQISADAQKIKEEAEQTNADAKLQAESIIAEARERAAEILKEKTDEGNAIIADATKKANEAINSSKIVAQNILDQAKEISDDLIEKSREEKEAYEILAGTLKKDAEDFIERVKSMYMEQLDFLNGAKLDKTSEESIEKAEAVHNLQDEVENLVSEMEEIESAIPDSISIDEPVANVVIDAPEEEESVIDYEVVADEEIEADEEVVTEEVDTVNIIEEIENALETVDAEVEIEIELESDEDEDDETTEEAEEIDFVEEMTEELEGDLEPVKLTDEADDEPADPMEAVAAFSKTNNETAEEKEESLFDADAELPFESFFKVNTNDAHGDKNQVISLVPPEDEEDDQPRFRGFFKKKK